MRLARPAGAVGAALLAGLLTACGPTPPAETETCRQLLGGNLSAAYHADKEDLDAELMDEVDYPLEALAPLEDWTDHPEERGSDALRELAIAANVELLDRAWTACELDDSASEYEQARADVETWSGNRWDATSEQR